MSIEAITDAILEYMYKKMNESPETEDEKYTTRGQKKI